MRVETAVSPASRSVNVKGRRVAVMHPDPGSADALAQALRSRGVEVVALSLNPESLHRVEGLDPDAVVMEITDFYGSCWEIVRALWQHPRLKFAPILLASPEGVASYAQGTPDVPSLCLAVQQVSEPYERLATACEQDSECTTSLHLLGPARVLRAFAESQRAFRITIECAQTTFEIDVAQGILVGAQARARNADNDLFLGVHALSLLMRQERGEVVGRLAEHPAVTNVMSPLDAALHAAREGTPVPAPKEEAAQVAVAPAFKAKRPTSHLSTKLKAAVPAAVLPADAVPANAVPSNAVPADALPMNAARETETTREPIKAASAPSAAAMPRLASTRRTMQGIALPQRPAEAAVVRPGPEPQTSHVPKATLVEHAESEADAGSSDAGSSDAGSMDDADCPTLPPAQLGPTPAARAQVSPAREPLSFDSAQAATANTLFAIPASAAARVEPAALALAPASAAALDLSIFENEDAAAGMAPSLPPEQALIALPAALSHPQEAPSAAAAPSPPLAMLVHARALWQRAQALPRVHQIAASAGLVVVLGSLVAFAFAGSASSGAKGATPPPVPARSVAPVVASAPAEAQKATAPAGTSPGLAEADPRLKLPAPTAAAPTTAAETGAIEDDEGDDEGGAKSERRKASHLVSQGHAFRKRKLYPAAKARYQEALQILPSYPRAQVGMVQVTSAQGQHREAIGMAQKLLQAHPSRENYQVLLGDTYAAANMQRDAREAYNAAARAGSATAKARLKSMR